MKGRCIIISGGEEDSLPLLHKGDFVIACDKGGEYADKKGIPVQLLLGDFDSYTFQEVHAGEIRRFPKEKDDTDTMLAVRFALEKGYEEIVLCCALGGRLDHLYANFQACAFAAERGCRIRIAGNREKIFFLHKGSMNIAPLKGYSLSIFSYSEKCEGVSVKGTKYELEKAVLYNNFPIGVSNEWKKEAVVTVEKGTLMIIMSKISERQPGK